MSLNYQNVAKSERKDALVPDPHEYNLTDPDRPLSVQDRLDLFARLNDDLAEDRIT